MNIYTDPKTFSVGDSGRPIGAATATALGKAYREIGGDPAGENDPSTLALKYFRAGVSQMARDGAKAISDLYVKHSESSDVVKYQAMTFRDAIQKMQERVDKGNPLTERQFRNLLAMVSSFRDNVIRSRRVAIDTNTPAEVGKVWTGWAEAVKRMPTLPDRPLSTQSGSSDRGRVLSSEAAGVVTHTYGPGQQAKRQPARAAQAGKRPWETESLQSRRARQLPQEQLLEGLRDYAPPHTEPGRKVPGPYADVEFPGESSARGPSPQGENVYDEANVPTRAPSRSRRGPPTHTNVPTRAPSQSRRGAGPPTHTNQPPAGGEDLDYETMAPGAAPQRHYTDMHPASPQGEASAEGGRPPLPRKPSAGGEPRPPLPRRPSPGREPRPPQSERQVSGPIEYTNPGYTAARRRIPTPEGRTPPGRRPPPPEGRLPTPPPSSPSAPMSPSGEGPVVLREKHAAAAKKEGSGLAKGKAETASKKIMDTPEGQLLEKSAAAAQRRRGRRS